MILHIWVWYFPTYIRFKTVYHVLGFWFYYKKSIIQTPEAMVECLHALLHEEGYDWNVWSWKIYAKHDSQVSCFSKVKNAISFLNCSFSLSITEKVPYQNQYGTQFDVVILRFHIIRINLVLSILILWKNFAAWDFR